MSKSPLDKQIKILYNIGTVRKGSTKTMVVTKTINITKRTTGEIIVENGEAVGVIQPTHSMYNDFLSLYNSLKTTDKTFREAVWNTNGEPLIAKAFDGNGESSEPTVELTPDEKLTRGLGNLIKFFSEFEFEPNYRFTNTLALKLANSKKSAKEYIENYFALVDNSYKNEVGAKMKSKEFGAILDDIAACGAPSRAVNNRFKVYYGSAGTGKTTLAQQESDNRCIICNASMLPADLMEDFVFVDGKPSFKPSKMWDCMTNGQPIVLDEINLLPFESLRFLQGVLDGKTEFDYKGHKVTIADGFQVIGTMNLTIGGMTFGLPEPLVDRSSDMRKFVLSADMLKGAF